MSHRYVASPSSYVYSSIVQKLTQTFSDGQWHRTTEGCIQCSEQGSGNSWYGAVAAAIALPIVLVWRLVIRPHIESQTVGLPEGNDMKHVGLETKFKIAVFSTEN